MFLQREDTSILQARSLSDPILADIPSKERWSKPDADNIQSPLFDRTLCKSYNWREEDIINLAVFVSMLVAHSPKPIKVVKHFSNAQLVLKKRKIWGGSQKKYADKKFIVSTSNLCNPYFTRRKFCSMKSERRHFHLVSKSSYLEMWTVLWDIWDLQSIVGKIK